MMRFRKHLFYFSLGLAMLTVSCGKARHADLVLKNGVIYTVDDAMSTAQAVAIAGGKFIAVGSNAEVERFVDAGTKVLDLGGKTVTPGLIDSHYHFMGVGKREYYLNLDGTKSMREFLDRVGAEGDPREAKRPQKDKTEWQQAERKQEALQE